MAKTLVIKGANFSTNKLTTVEFNDIPCTAVAWGADSYTATSTGALSATYTLTPADTTDDVIITSSDTSVVDIISGVPTVVGVGDCTITITCGSYSDTATVSVSILYVFDWNFVLLTAHSNGYINASPNTNARLGTSATGDQATTYIAYGAGYSKPVIKLPANTGRVKIKTTNTSAFANSSDSQVIWGKDESAGYSTEARAIKVVSAEDKYNIRSDAEKTYTVPSGVNAVAFTTKLASTAQSTDDPNTIATTCGLSIEFLPAAT